MSDETPRKPIDWSTVEIPSIPADDPIYTEGVIITFPVKPMARITESSEVLGFLEKALDEETEQ